MNITKNMIFLLFIAISGYFFWIMVNKINSCNCNKPINDMNNNDNKYLFQNKHLVEGLAGLNSNQVFNTNISCDKLCARIKKGQSCNIFEKNKMIKCLDRNNKLISPKCIKAKPTSTNNCTCIF